MNEKEKIGITLDIGHVNLYAKGEGVASEEWICNTIGKFGDNIYNVHLHDNHGESDEHLPPGNGSIDFGPIFETLDSKYNGPLILEIWSPSNPSEAGKKAVERTRDLL